MLLLTTATFTADALAESGNTLPLNPLTGTGDPLLLLDGALENSKSVGDGETPAVESEDE